MENKTNPLTIGILAVFGIALVAALFGGGVSGRATSVIIVPLDFPVIAEYTNGWGDCSGQTVDWTTVDSFCKSKGYAGAAPITYRPCLHEANIPTRYYWDGSLPMSVDMEQTQNTAGFAFTAVKCSI